VEEAGDGVVLLAWGAEAQAVGAQSKTQAVPTINQARRAECIPL
jgi:hypothetical protein